MYDLPDIHFRFFEMQVVIICNLIHCWEWKIKKKMNFFWDFSSNYYKFVHYYPLSGREVCVRKPFFEEVTSIKCTGIYCYSYI